MFQTGPQLLLLHTNVISSPGAARDNGRKLQINKIENNIKISSASFLILPLFSSFEL
jgi:hypothetical protein